MSEPEDVLLDGAHIASSMAAALWRRRRRGPAMLELGDIRARLELLIAAIHPAPPLIVPAQPPARPTPLARWVRRIPRHLLESRALASTDGARLRLPPSLDAARGREHAVVSYRLLAVGQSMRAERGTPNLLHGLVDPLTRDLYWIAEAAIIDIRIATEFPGWIPALEAARLDALRSRATLPRATPAEDTVEAWIRALLGAPLQSPPLPLTWTTGGQGLDNPDASVAWARKTALREDLCEGRYRGLPAIPLWGVPEVPGAESRGTTLVEAEPGPDEPQPRAERVGSMLRRPKVRQELEDEDDDSSGMWSVQLDDPQEHVEDPMGLQRPTDRDEEANSDELADSLSELPEARLVPVPGSPAEVLMSPDPPDGRAAMQTPPTTGAGITYPEWDWRSESYLPGHVVVRIGPTPAGELSWSEDVLEKHASEVRRIRRTFERLRPRRIRLRRQLDGPDVDLAAWTSSWATARAGGPFDDRLYEQVRPTRRDLAISLLVDVSGSTDSWVAGTRRIVDVEKEALLLVCEGLDALGDRYNVLTFSGEGPRGVAVSTVKGFDERDLLQTRRRIASMQPDRYTRIGAAVRHATTLLTREAAPHRLLLVISDGKPNDVDQYEGRYGVEDARQAVAEARLQGVHSFCLTVDRQAPSYIQRLFGPSGFTVLRDPARLPEALIDVVQLLIRS